MLSGSSGFEVQVSPLGLLKARMTSPFLVPTGFPSTATTSPSETLSPRTATLPLMVTLPSSTSLSAARREATPASLMYLLRRVPSGMAISNGRNSLKTADGSCSYQNTMIFLSRSYSHRFSGICSNITSEDRPMGWQGTERCRVEREPLTSESVITSSGQRSREHTCRPTFLP